VSPLGEAALELAAAGHPVLPLHNPDERGRCSCGRECGRTGKHPRGVYGLNHASTDPRQIEAWWHGQPEANLGMRCDGLVVLDLDGPTGHRSLSELEWELGELPPTRSQRTQRGEHRFFSTPAEVLLGNSTAPLGHPPELDLRAGTRGYVVVAPSRPGYRWLDPEAPFEPLPQPWLTRLLELPSLPPASGGVKPGGVCTGSTPYGLAALDGELRKIGTATEGSRNETLNKSVFRLAQLAAGGELELDLIEPLAKDAAQLAGLDWLEIDLTIASALNAGFRFPRSRNPR
jgi:Bifunctional DNA primase/polymerase, N-terminal